MQLFVFLFNIYAIWTVYYRKLRRIVEIFKQQSVSIVIFLTLRVFAEIVCLFLQRPLVFAAVMCLFLPDRCCRAAKNAFDTLKWLAEPVILIDWVDGFGRRSDLNKTFNNGSRGWSEKEGKEEEKNKKKNLNCF